MRLQLQPAVLAEFTPGRLQELLLMPGGFNAPFQVLPGQFLLMSGPIRLIHCRYSCSFGHIQIYRYLPVMWMRALNHGDHFMKHVVITADP
jgi:hypothetical protein